MKKITTFRALCSVLAVCGAIAAIGCGGKKEEAAPTAPGGSSPALQSQLNNPNLSPEVKEKMKASANVTPGGAAPAAGGGK